MTTWNLAKMATKIVGNYYCESGSYAEFSSSIANLNDSIIVYVDYNKYIKSALWEKRVEIYKQYYGPICQLHHRKTTKGLCLHHRHYRNNIGHEELDDVILICKKCHARLHKEEIENRGYTRLPVTGSFQSHLMDIIENL